MKGSILKCHICTLNQFAGINVLYCFYTILVMNVKLRGLCLTEKLNRFQSESVISKFEHNQTCFTESVISKFC
jgi:hypothetical protein